MKKLLSISLLALLFFMTSCSNPIGYKDEDIVAIVRGEEITIGDMRFLYADEDVLTRIDGTIKAMLVMQEAKKMNIDVSEEIETLIWAAEQYVIEDDDTEYGRSVRAFNESQAEKLGMDPKEYYVEYTKRSLEISAFVNAYVQEMLPGPVEELTDEAANEILDELVVANEAEIEIFIEDKGE